MTEQAETPTEQKAWATLERFWSDPNGGHSEREEDEARTAYAFLSALSAESETPSAFHERFSRLLWQHPKRKSTEDASSYEFVDHPEHYNSHPAGIECIEVIEHMVGNVALAIKHIWRAGLKPGAEHDQDLAKAIWYLERERGRLLTLGTPRDTRRLMRTL